MEYQKKEQKPAKKHEEKAEEKVNKEELKNEFDKLKDQFIRLQADFDNYRKRKENEMLSIIKNANKDLIKDVLIIIDDFERALKSVKDEESIIQGFKLIYSKLLKILEAQGLKKIQALGKEFDHNLHEVISQVKDENKKDGTIIEEVNSGYTVGDEVLRPSKVIIINNEVN